MLFVCASTPAREREEKNTRAREEEEEEEVHSGRAARSLRGASATC